MHEGGQRTDASAVGGEASGARADAPGRRVVVYGGALVGGLLVALAGAVLVAPPVGIAGGVVFGLAVIAQGRRTARAPRRKP